MTLRDKLDQITSLESSALVNLPWEVRRILPDIKVAGDQISFAQNGDYVTADEALAALEMMVKQLKPSTPLEKTMAALPVESPEAFEKKVIERLRKSTKPKKKKDKKK